MGVIDEALTDVCKVFSSDFSMRTLILDTFTDMGAVMIAFNAAGWIRGVHVKGVEMGTDAFKRVEGLHDALDQKLVLTVKEMSYLNGRSASLQKSVLCRYRLARRTVRRG